MEGASQDAWSRWCSELSILKDVQVPRYLFASHMTIPADDQIHVFTDANPRAYDAVVYVIIEECGDAVSAQFLLAKARMAPLKQLSLRRLELMQAWLARYIEVKVFSTVAAVFYGAHSAITLVWIRGTNKKWETSVSNPVSENIIW